MGQNFGIIVVLLIVAWQVVSAIVNQINTNKQQQQARLRQNHRSG